MPQRWTSEPSQMALNRHSEKWNREEHILAFNLGAVLDKATTNKALYSLAQSIDLIRFAQIAFAAFALARVAKISFTKSLVGQIAIWAVFTALGMVGASLF